jgi:hypothetical protein
MAIWIPVVLLLQFTSESAVSPVEGFQMFQKKW